MFTQSLCPLPLAPRVPEQLGLNTIGGEQLGQ